MPRRPRSLTLALSRNARARPPRAVVDWPGRRRRDVRPRPVAPPAPPRGGGLAVWSGAAETGLSGAAAGCLGERWRGADGGLSASRLEVLALERGGGDDGADPRTQQVRRAARPGPAIGAGAAAAAHVAAELSGRPGRGRGGARGGQGAPAPAGTALRGNSGLDVRAGTLVGSLYLF